MTKSNFPNAKLSSLPTEYVKDTVDSLQEIANLGKISRNQNQDAEFEDRVKMIIDFCKNKGLRPGIETICAGIGITRSELHNWKNGAGNVSKRRQEAVQQVCQLIYAFLEQAGMSNKLNPTLYVWLSKNWMGYLDVVRVESGDEHGFNTPQQSREEIAAKYSAFKNLPEPEKPLEL